MKKTKGFGLPSIIIIIIITAIVSSIATGVIMLNSSSNIISVNNDLTDDEDLKEFISVYSTLVSKYYNEIDKEGMLNAAEEGMLDFLGDKYTTYLDNEEYKDIIDELSGTYNGIGISIKNNKIVGVTLNSPADKSGLLKEDILIKVNGINVENMSGDDIGGIIKNNSNNAVSLEINRNGEILHFVVEKENLPTISYEILENTNIGYLYIKNFSKNLSSQINNALKELEELNITSLIIDVRDNVGGYLSSAEKTAELFLESGKTIYSLKTSDNTSTYKDNTKESRDYPIAVLINNNSASAAEILAAALKESYNAILVGVKSYGKGVVQQVFSLNSGDSAKFTYAKWLTPKGTCIDGIGLMPDYTISYTKTEKSDSQIDKAKEILMKQ